MIRPRYPETFNIEVVKQVIEHGRSVVDVSSRALCQRVKDKVCVHTGPVRSARCRTLKSTEVTSMLG